MGNSTGGKASFIPNISGPSKVGLKSLYFSHLIHLYHLQRVAQKRQKTSSSGVLLFFFFFCRFWWEETSALICSLMGNKQQLNQLLDLCVIFKDERT